MTEYESWVEHWRFPVDMEGNVKIITRRRGARIVAVLQTLYPVVNPPPGKPEHDAYEVTVLLEREAPKKEPRETRAVFGRSLADGSNYLEVTDRETLTLLEDVLDRKVKAKIVILEEEP